MGFNNKYPYTDFHEMNEDWFLLHFKEVMEAVHQNNETVKGLIEYIHSLGLVVIDDATPALDKVYSSRHTQDLLDGKVDKVTGMGLSQNNFTSALKNKLDGIETGANKTVVDDYMAALQTNPVEGGVIYQALNNKVDKVAGKQLSQENYTSTEKTKLAGIAEDATKTEIDDTFNSGLKIGTISINDVDTDLNVPVDDTLSYTSEYPLQNKAIYDLIEEILPEVTATGNPISINDAFGLPAKSCEVAFSPVQSGSGNPSPDNVRPFVLWEELNLYEDTEETLTPAHTYTETLANGVAGCIFNFVNGKLYKTHEILDLSQMTWSNTSWEAVRTDIPNIYVSTTTLGNSLMEKYTESSYTYLNQNKPNNHFAVSQNRWYIICDGTPNGNVCAKLKNPVEIQLTGNIINLLKGDNVIWSDANGDVTLVYAADIKKWVLNQ